MVQRQPKVCFVILNWNQPELTRQCLLSLRRLDYANFTTVLVDNGSTDGAYQALETDFPEVTLVHLDSNVGYSPGNNIGIEAALDGDCDYLFLLNNDTEVDPPMLGTLVSAAEADPKVGMVGPTMYFAEPPDLVWGAENRIDFATGRTIRQGMGTHVPFDGLLGLQPRLVDYVDTCAVLVKREAAQAIGPMDGRFFINYDDLDWNVRATKSGYRILYVPGARMWHKVSATMGLASPATTYYMTRNSLLFFGKHAPGPWRLSTTARLLAAAMRTTAAWSVRRQYRTDVFRRRRDANLLAVRDFLMRRFGRMGPDVARVCYGA